MKSMIFYPLPLLRKQHGLTLIELMVAMIIGLVLIAGVVQIYLSTKQSYRLQENLGRMQENARFALDFISYDARMAGYRGCAGPDTPLTNTLNNNTSFAWNFRTAVQGFSRSADGNWTPGTPPTVIANDAVVDSDVLVTRTAEGPGVRVTNHPAGGNDPNLPGSANLQVPANHGFKQCDILMVTDCEEAAVFQVTSVASGNALVHNTGAVPQCSGGPGNATKQLGKNYEVSGEVIRLTTKVYYIRMGAGGLPGLWMQSGAGPSQELIQGVERMRVLYGVRTALSDALVYRPAANVSDWGDVVSIRVSLLVQSPENNIVTEQQQYIFPGSSGNPETIDASDRRLRQVFASTIGLRNRLP
jgi:type IV pilus assembly protein PilW